MQVPFRLVQSGSLCDLLAPLMQKAVVEMTLRGRENQWTVPEPRVFAENLSDFGGDGDGALFPIFRQKSVLRFCSDVNTPMRKIQVRPMERLEFTATKARRERE